MPATKTANFTDYTKDGFSYDDHVRLANLYRKLDSKGVKIMLTNNNVDLVYELYKGFNIEVVPAKRMINRDSKNRKGEEVIITNDE
ncbi:DNA adenine methylase [Mycoplasma sp. CSL7491-lung]|uniref:DNA adenine methylase n=1 Tax=Mycoplasma sp. CSL7491-lung TaxID=549718 RepID=UPI00280B4FC9|nr:DNA adenine methylase [Mycoplasma sp. CSL7491-lung]